MGDTEMGDFLASIFLYDYVILKSNSKYLKMHMLVLEVLNWNT